MLTLDESAAIRMLTWALGLLWSARTGDKRHVVGVTLHAQWHTGEVGLSPWIVRHYATGKKPAKPWRQRRFEQRHNREGVKTNG